jgi:hypothetical protein
MDGGLLQVPVETFRREAPAVGLLQPANRRVLFRPRHNAGTTQ